MTFTVTVASVAALIAAGSLLLGIFALILNRIWKLGDEERERLRKAEMQLASIVTLVGQAKDERASIASAMDRNTEILVGMSQRWRPCPHDTAARLGQPLTHEPLPSPPWEKKK